MGRKPFSGRSTFSPNHVPRKAVRRVVDFIIVVVVRSKLPKRDVRQLVIVERLDHELSQAIKPRLPFLNRAVGDFGAKGPQQILDVERRF